MDNSVVDRDRLIGPLPAPLAALDRPALWARLQELNAEVDAGYWGFSRQARGRLVSAAVYVDRAWTWEAYKRAPRARDRRL